MKMTKKKVFALALAICLFAVVSMGTLAWFNDSDSITNTFMVANSDDDDNIPTFSVEVVETDPDTGSETDTGVTYHNVLPGDIIDKNPTIRNTGDYDQWIRVAVTLTKAQGWEAGGGSLKFTDLFTGSTYDLTENVGNTTHTWLLVSDETTVVDDKATWYLYLRRSLPANDSEVLFKSVKIPENFTQEDMLAFNNDFEILVSADALQFDNTSNNNAVEAFAYVNWAEGTAFTDID